MILAVASTLALGACSDSSTGKASKGGGQKGTAAMGTGQKAGSSAEGDKSKGMDESATYEGVTCDSSTEGLAWCDSDTDIAFCAGGEWWLLDCSHPDIGGDFCGDDGDTIDCYAASDF
jgi:hypothetical protein